MVYTIQRSTLVFRTALLGSLIATAGCHYVKQGDLDSEIARLRQEMTSGDDRVAGQVNALDARMDARMRTLETGLESFENEFGARVERIEGSLRIQTPITYNFDASDLEETELPVLDRLASILKENYPDALLTVEGFTDPAGSTAYNLKLGMRRAEGVRSYLVSTGGLSQDQVRAVSYGESKERLVSPGAEGPGVVGRANRRTVIVIDHPGSGQAQRERPVTQ